MNRNELTDRIGFVERELFVLKNLKTNCTTCDNGGGGSKRQEVKVLLRRLKRDNPNIENSIFRSIHGVALDTMPGYKTEGQEHSFLERFDRVEAELQKELKEKQKQEADKTE